MSFENTSVVIFGATGGIGSALGRQLAPQGCRLTLAARDPSRLDRLAGELHAQTCSVQATDSEAVDRCLAEASERYGRLDGVVNCVGPVLTRTPLTAPVTGNALTLKASAALHPLGRIGEPDEVASAIRWFLSPEQGWVTGQMLAVDGGLSALQARMASNP